VVYIIPSKEISNYFYRHICNNLIISKYFDTFYSYPASWLDEKGNTAVFHKCG